MSKVTFVSRARLIGKVIALSESLNPLDSNTASVSAIIFPESRFPGGVGGSNSRVLVRSGIVNGKPSYTHADELIVWTSSQWEMQSAFGGTVNYSPEDTQYPWQVSVWYYGTGDVAADVDAVPVTV